MVGVQLVSCALGPRSDLNGPRLSDVCVACFPLPVACAGLGLMHTTARKKSTPLLTRLLRKSRVRDEPWAPDLRLEFKSPSFPHASASTLAPVAVK